jgi:predicted RNA polymerase sigma factor
MGRALPALAGPGAGIAPLHRGAAALSMSADARAAIERAARESRARLVAFLAARSRDVAAAEDALADAFRAALETWPVSGVPGRPEAWLLTAARRRLIDAARHAAVRADAAPTLRAMAEAEVELGTSGVTFPDERLKLLFVCAHPAIDAAARTALMLQTVLGLDAARIAAAFLVKPAAMGQRLSRAKAKIRDAGIAFAVPGAAELPPRLNAVLEAIYAAYGTGWDDPVGADPRRRGLAEEALELGRLLLSLLPEDPEAKGLLALMLHCEARRAARRSADGAYVPLSEQDTALWSRPMIAEAERLLASAERAGRLGRFQLEAAIQSAHARRAVTGRTDWQAVALLYEGLARVAPTVGALVGRAAAVAEACGPGVGWELLQAIPPGAVAAYQPYWALAAHLLTQMNHPDAASAFHRAIGLCKDPAARAFLLRRAGRLAG